MPSAASCATSLWICALAPMSMPRVGSSRMSSRGFVTSQRARSTFCWLPPERRPTTASGSAGRMSSVSIQRATSSSLVRFGRGRAQPRAACMASTRLSRIDRSARIPSPLRSSEQKAIPDAMAARGVRSVSSRPPTRMVPESGRSAPKSRRASSVRPLPSRPARPTTSPARMVRSKGATEPRRPSPDASRTGGASAVPDPASSARRSTSSSTPSSRPIIADTSWMRDRSRVRYSPTSRPLRSTVIRSAIS